MMACACSMVAGCLVFCFVSGGSGDLFGGIVMVGAWAGALLAGWLAKRGLNKRVI